MKKFINEKWFPLIVVVIAVTLVALVMALLGWKITYAPDLENSWDAISAIAAWAGAIGTVIVLWYNHKAIKLTQRSVQQAIGLQLYEKRLELYSALSGDTAFEQVPLSLKIVYSEEIYNLYGEISKLCHELSENILEFSVFYKIPNQRETVLLNVCEPLFQDYLKNIEAAIRSTSLQEETLTRHKTRAKDLHQKICYQYNELESKMKEILEKSIDIEA